MVFKIFEHMKSLPQMVDEIKIRFAQDIGKPKRITSDKAKGPNEAS